MKKLTKKQKAAYPEFIVMLDVATYGREDFEGMKGYRNGFYIKAMEETDVFAAMRRIEAVIQYYGGSIYLADILGKNGEEADDGAPLYEVKMRTRVHVSEWEKDEYGEKKAQASTWHFCDKEHSENDDFKYRWYPDKDRYGDIEFIMK